MIFSEVKFVKKIDKNKKHTIWPEGPYRSGQVGNSILFPQFAVLLFEAHVFDVTSITIQNRLC
jgi:hypothetical protein